MVRVDSEKNIDLAANSSLGGGRPGRNKRKSLKNKKKQKTNDSNNFKYKLNIFH